MPKLRVIISGRVQGVGYRAWTIKTASALKLKGWVRNRVDGTVEAVFSGEDMQVNTMLEACKKGPFVARVDGLDIFEWNEAIGDGFVAKETV